MLGEVARPDAVRVGGHDPQLYARQPADADRLFRRAHLEPLVGRPVGDAAVVRDDARAGLELEQPRQSLAFKAGSRYILITLARRKPVSQMSPGSKRAPFAKPALLA